MGIAVGPFEGRTAPAAGKSKNRNLGESMKRIMGIAVVVAAFAATSMFAADAKATYEKECLKCHGADGKGDTKMGKKLGAKDYSDPKVQAALKDEAGIKAIREGLKDKDGKVLMKPDPNISEAEAKALVDYMRTFKK